MAERHPKVLTVGPDINGHGGLSALMRAYAGVFDDFTLLPYNSRHGSALSLLTRALTMVRMPLYRCAGFDIFHVHTHSDDTFLRAVRLLRWSRRLGFRTVLHCHNDNFRSFLAESPAEYADAVRKADAIVVLSESRISFFRDELGCRKVVAIPNFVPDVRVVRNRSKRRQEEPLRLLYLGKLTDEKGIFDLVQALEPLAAKYSGYLELAVAGTGDSAALIKYIDDLKLDRTVRFEGWVERISKDKLLRLSDILVVPSHNEGMPAEVLEAGTYGMACIASDVGAISDVVKHGVNGYLVQPGHPEQLTEAIQFYLDNPQEIARQGQAARKYIEPFLPVAVRQRLDELYNSI